MKPTILAIIPARGGSKGVPRKNIRILSGKPLIAWTIETALACLLLDRVIVSTEDQEIAEIARTHGAEVPFLRPESLAKDDTPGLEPVIHALLWLEENQAYRPDYVLLLQPTSPLRISQDIKRAIEKLKSSNSEAIISVTPVKHHPYWTKRLTDDGKLKDFLLVDHPLLRQDLPPAYALNGAIYLATRDVVLQQHSFYAQNNTNGYVMPPERSLDIDSSWDFEVADLILRKRERLR